MLRDLAKHPEVQAKIWEELTVIEDNTDESSETEEIVSLLNTHQLHWVRAARSETIRMTCSPIVPHRATKDTSLGGESESDCCSLCFLFSPLVILNGRGRGKLNIKLGMSLSLRPCKLVFNPQQKLVKT